MTNVLKKTARNAIPEELRDAIATENEATTLEELKDFLASHAG
jgi:CO dehydrogenase/acetyl-CoA synthase beta subunit